MKKIPVFFLFIFPYLLISQNSDKTYFYKGEIVDEANHFIVEGAHIYSNSLKLGTISNSNGAFLLKSKTEIRELVISHINFQTQLIKFDSLPQSDTLNFKIQLKPNVQSLVEVLVRALSARQVILNAIEKLDDNHQVKQVSYDFFTRIVNYQKDSTLNFIEEHVGLVAQNSRNNSRFKLYQSRIKALSALGKEEVADHRLISLTEMFTDNIGKYTEDFLHKRKQKNYDYSFDDDVEIMGRACYKIYFETPKSSYNKKGYLYVDKQNYGIARKTLDHSDFKEITYKFLDGKYYLSNTKYVMRRSQFIQERLTVYNIAEKDQEEIDFLPMKNVVVGKIKEVVGEFNDTFWDFYNIVPLPEWVKIRMEE